MLRRLTRAQRVADQQLTFMPSVKSCGARGGSFPGEGVEFRVPVCSSLRQQSARRSFLDSSAAMHTGKRGTPWTRARPAKRRRRTRTSAGGACASTPGPRDTSEAQNDWTDVQRWRAATASPLADRLAIKVRAGVDLTSHYSGTGAAESALAAIAGDQLTSYSACDIDLVCQDVLVHHEGASAPRHVFADLCDRPPVEIMQELRLRLKQAQIKAGVARGSASAPAAQATGGGPETIQRVGREWVREAMAILAAWSPTRDDMGQCVRHGRQCRIFPPRGSRYHIEVSGVNCQPWSAVGKKLGWLDDRSLPCLVLVQTILCIEPSAVCIECTPAFDFATLRELLAAKYQGSCAQTCPTDFGLPVRRPRLYMWFDSMSCLDEEHVDIDCCLLAARRSVRLSPRDYLKVATADRRRHYEDMWREYTGSAPPRPLLRRMVRKGPGPMPPVAKYLAPGLLSRYRSHREAVAKIRKNEKDCFVVDINQSATYGRASTPNVFPTILKTSVLVVLSADEANDSMLVPEELLSIHGIDLPSSVLRRLKLRRVRQLLGNSMHVVQVGTFIQCALATRTWSGDQ